MRREGLDFVPKDGIVRALSGSIGGRNRFQGVGNQEFILGHVGFEVPARYPSVDVSRQLDRRF